MGCPSGNCEHGASQDKQISTVINNLPTKETANERAKISAGSAKVTLATNNNGADAITTTRDTNFTVDLTVANGNAFTLNLNSVDADIRADIAAFKNSRTFYYLWDLTKTIWNQDDAQNFTLDFGGIIVKSDKFKQQDGQVVLEVTKGHEKVALTGVEATADARVGLALVQAAVDAESASGGKIWCSCSAYNDTTDKWDNVEIMSCEFNRTLAANSTNILKTTA